MSLAATLGAMLGAAEPVLAQCGSSGAYAGPGNPASLPYTLSNPQLLVRFEASAFGAELRSLTHRASGKSQVFLPAPMFELVARPGTLADTTITPNNVQVFDFRDNVDAANVLHFYFPTVVNLPGSTVTVYVQIEARLRDGEDRVLWSAWMDEHRPHCVPNAPWTYVSSRLTWPILRIAEPTSPSSVPLFVTGSNGGVRHHAPFQDLVSDASGSGFVQTHPGLQQLSVMAYVDEGAGYAVYVDVDEDKLEPATKEFRLRGDDGELQFSIGALPDTAAPRWTWSSPYRVTTSIFETGASSWYDVTDRYRSSQPVQDLLAANFRRQQHQDLGNRLALFQLFGPNLLGCRPPDCTTMGCPGASPCPVPPDAQAEMSYFFALAAELGVSAARMYLQVDRTALNEHLRIFLQRFGFLFFQYNLTGRVTNHDSPQDQALLNPFRARDSSGTPLEILELDHQPVIDVRTSQFETQVVLEGSSGVYCDVFPSTGFETVCYDPTHGHAVEDVQQFHARLSGFVDALKAHDFRHPLGEELLLSNEYFQEFGVPYTDFQGGKLVRDFAGRFHSGNPLNYIAAGSVPMLRAVYGSETVLGEIPVLWAYDSIQLWESMLQLVESFCGSQNPTCVEAVWKSLHILTRAHLGHIALHVKPSHLTGHAEGSFWIDTAYDLSAGTPYDLSVWDQDDYRNYYAQAVALHKPTGVADLKNHGKMLRPLTVHSASSSIPVVDSYLRGRDRPGWSVPLAGESTPHVLHATYGDGGKAVVILYNRKEIAEGYDFVMSISDLELPGGVGTQYRVFRGDWSASSKTFVETQIGFVTQSTPLSIVDQLGDGHFRYYIVRP